MITTVIVRLVRPDIFLMAQADVRLARLNIAPAVPAMMPAVIVHNVLRDISCKVALVSLVRKFRIATAQPAMMLLANVLNAKADGRLITVNVTRLAMTMMIVQQVTSVPSR